MTLKTAWQLIFITACCFVFCNCEKKPVTESSFYYWRQSGLVSLKEKSTIQQYNVKHLYVKLFDVDFISNSNMPLPIGIINTVDSLKLVADIIPVVFITNRTFTKLTVSDAQQLAHLLYEKVNSIYSNYNELQIDCDWSETTREKYFAFLKELKQLITTKIVLSATIRLHQIKYPNITGVPPVNKGMLMFYNMGNVSDENEVNSIYNKTIAKKYTAYVKQYQLPLDAALPIFSWLVQYRNHQLVELINKTNMPDLNEAKYFSSEKNSSNFKVVNDYYLKGIFYKKGDVLRYEQLSNESLLEAADLLKSNLPDTNRRIILFDLNETYINAYDKQTIKTIFDIPN